MLPNFYAALASKRQNCSKSLGIIAVMFISRQGVGFRVWDKTRDRTTVDVEAIDRLATGQDLIRDLAPE